MTGRKEPNPRPPEGVRPAPPKPPPPPPPVFPKAIQQGSATDEQVREQMHLTGEIRSFRDAHFLANGNEVLLWRRMRREMEETYVACVRFRVKRQILCTLPKPFNGGCCPECSLPSILEHFLGLDEDASQKIWDQVKKEPQP